MTHQTNWRTPLVILLCGGLILTLSLGLRHGFGLFLKPMTLDLGWSRETFAFALALQNLVWGAAQPVAGAIADKLGAGRVLAGGGLLYALGLVLMAHSGTGLEFSLSAGILVGLGLSGTSFGVVYGVIARAFPPEKRSMALGIAGAAGSFGQFSLLPVGQALIAQYGWYVALLAIGGLAAIMTPLAVALAGAPRSAGHPGAAKQSLAEALREAGAHRGFWLLTFGFFVCGFQVVFIGVHFPAFLADRGLSPVTGMTALALIGLFNIFGTYGCGWLGGRYSKKYLLAALYLLRGVAIILFLAFPITPASVYLFAATMGLLWLGTVPLTSGLVAQIFGVNYLATLFGIVFFSHQVGSFAGVWLGGYSYDLTGSYQVVWVISIGLSVVAALLHWPIDEREVVRPAVGQKPA
ncbi:MAG: MFS transporter [Betaproteobacteria bacterium]|nr:MFS transporter [Betaproteobacteria bacterium]